MFFQLLKQFRGLVLLLIFVGIVASLLEALTLTMFIPIIEGIGSVSASNMPFPLSHISKFFVHFNFIQRLRIVAILLIVITLIKGAALYFNGILSAKLEIAVAEYQRLICHKRLLDVQMGYFNSLKGAHLYTFVFHHSGMIANIARAIAEIGPSLFTLVVLFSMLLLISWKMTLLACSFAAFSSFILQHFQRRAVAAGETITQVNKGMNSTILDFINGMKIVRLFNRGSSMIARFADDLKRWGDALMEVARVQASTRPVFEITSIVGLAMLLIAGSFIFHGGINTLDIKLLVTFLLIFSRLHPPVAALNRARVSIGSMFPIAKDVFKFLEESADYKVKNGNKVFKGLQKGIKFENVNFAYRSDGEAKVLQDISLYIPKGLKLGIAGPSGVGKSTFIELILRFYDPQSGRILVDGIDLKDLKLESWRPYIGVVDQNTFLFNDTIKANITYGKPEVTQREIEDAARRAHAHEFIKKLPQGYDTTVGDRGVLLSGGERQRLAIARAIIMNPEVLIFDEATSALDTESEQIVQKALDEVGEGRTVITIAHRLSTITESDMIIVLESGRIVQQGTHSELLRQESSLYLKLVRMQSLEGRGGPNEIESQRREALL